MNPDPVHPPYVCVWEFEVPASARAEFLRYYGPGGTWETLFRLDPEYIGTQLLEDRARSGRFLTVDRWRTERAFQDFRVRYAERYAALDRECESLTSRETSLGAFYEVPA